MTMIPFDPTNPSLNDPRASVDVRNNLNALFNGDSFPLRARAQASPNMTVAVAACDVESFWRQVWVGTETPLNFTGGNSPSLTAPSSNPRISLLTIDSAGTLAWTNGAEAASPVPPSCPLGKVPICYVYCVTTMTKIYNYEDHTSYPTHGYIYRDVRPVINLGGGIPTGGIIPFGGTSAPTGWLFCDGSAVSETTYAGLFTVIGHTFGDPGGGNFNLPDLRQKFPLGKAASGTGSTLGGTGGNIDHTHTESHTHQATPDDADVNVAGQDPPNILELVYKQTFATAGPSNANTGAANPPFLALNFIIKT